jgi:hypothetical protein
MMQLRKKKRDVAVKKRDAAIKILCEKYDSLSPCEVNRVYKSLEEKDNRVKDWGKEVFTSISERDGSLETTGEVILIVISKFDNFYKNMENATAVNTCAK